MPCRIKPQEGEKTMKKRLPAIVLTLLLALLLAVPCMQPASATQGDYIAANHTPSNGLPYYIMVNRAQNTVTVYTLGANGYYSVPVKAMVCSTGRQGHETPLGTFTIANKSAWTYMVDGSYGQYSSQFFGAYLFHSVCYYRMDPSSLITEEYNGLGAQASLGCVRLQTEDAKWIFDNCGWGTYVTIYDGTSPGPLGKPSRLVDYIAPDHPAGGWDPTDPRTENPWHKILAAPKYYDVPVNWALENGITVGTGSGEFNPDTVCSYVRTLTMLWRAAGEPVSTATVPFAIDEAAWYADALRWAAEKGMIDQSFQMNASCARADAVTYIWKAFGSPRAGTAKFTDVNATESFAPAVAWAVENGITNGTTSTTFSPYKSCTQAQLLTFLYRAYQK